MAVSLRWCGALRPASENHAKKQLEKEEETRMSNLFVVVMGIGTVFFGLICIIVLSMAMSAICRSMGGTPTPAPVVPAPPPAPAASAAIPNRQAMIAAIAAAIAEDLGTDPAGIQILSVKQM